jgi:hypothetical protein
MWCTCAAVGGGCGGPSQQHHHHRPGDGPRWHHQRTHRHSSSSRRRAPSPAVLQPGCAHWRVSGAAAPSTPAAGVSPGEGPDGRQRMQGSVPRTRTGQGCWQAPSPSCCAMAAVQVAGGVHTASCTAPAHVKCQSASFCCYIAALGLLPFLQSTPIGSTLLDPAITNRVHLGEDSRTILAQPGPSNGLHPGVHTHSLIACTHTRHCLRHGPYCRRWCEWQVWWRCLRVAPPPCPPSMCAQGWSSAALRSPLWRVRQQHTDCQRLSCGTCLMSHAA